MWLVDLDDILGISLFFHRPPIVEMEEEDEYDYDIYDESDSGFSDDIALRPPSSNPDEEKEKDEDEEFEVVSGSIFQCPAPGFYPHEDNCREFYVCQGGTM